MTEQFHSVAFLQEQAVGFFITVFHIFSQLSILMSSTKKVALLSVYKTKEALSIAN